MIKPLSEGNLYAIYAVLADYRQARDQDDTRAIAHIAAGLDAWLRSLLEIVKSQAEELDAIRSWINQHLYGELIMLRDADGRLIRHNPGTLCDADCLERARKLLNRDDEQKEGFDVSTTESSV